LWEFEKITSEMAIGHIIQNLVNLQKSIDAANTSYFRLSADVDELKKPAACQKSPR
jgi:hypothetical protein